MNSDVWCIGSNVFLTNQQVNFLSENVGEVQPVAALKGPLGGSAAQRKCLSLPLSIQQASQNTVSKPPLDTQTSAHFSPPLPELQQIGKEVGRSTLGRHQISTEANAFDGKLEVAGRPLSIVPMGSTGGPQPADSSLTVSSSPGVASPLKRLSAGEKKPQKLMLVAPPAAAEGDSAAVQGVARLLTTTSFCKAPVSVAVVSVLSASTQKPGILK